MSAIPVTAICDTTPRRARTVSAESLFPLRTAEAGIAETMAARGDRMDALALENQRDAEELCHAKSHLARLRHRIGALEMRLAERGRKCFLITQEREALERRRVAEQARAERAKDAARKVASTTQRLSEGSAAQKATVEAESLPEAQSQAPAVDPSPPRNRRMRVTVGPTTASNFYVGFAGTVDEGGMFVATYDSLPRGTCLDADIVLPGRDRPVRCVVQVAWTNEYREGEDVSRGAVPGVGFRFVELKGEDREAVESYVASEQPLFFPEDELLY